MKKTIEQILNETLIGQSICTGNNEIGVIKKVKINRTGGTYLGSFTLDINGKIKNDVFGNWEINFTDSTEQQKIELEMHFADIKGFPTRIYNILRKNGFVYVKDIFNYKKINGNFDKIEDAGKSFNKEVNSILDRLL